MSADGVMGSWKNASGGSKAVGVCNSSGSLPKKKDEPKSVILTLQFTTWSLGTMIRFMGMMACAGAHDWMGALSILVIWTSKRFAKLFIDIFDTQGIKVNRLEKKNVASMEIFGIV